MATEDDPRQKPRLGQLMQLAGDVVPVDFGPYLMPQLFAPWSWGGQMYNRQMGPLLKSDLKQPINTNAPLMTPEK